MTDSHDGLRSSSRLAKVASRPWQAWVVASMVLGLAMVEAGTVESPGNELGRLRSENRALEARLDLAASEEFYLIVDPAGRELRLMLRGATLQSYEIVDLDLGEPRVFFISRRPLRDWMGRSWTGGRLQPARRRDRFELRVPEGGQNGTPTEIPIPPRPEESFPVPGRYRVRYAGGLSLEVRRQGDDDTLIGLPRRWLSDAAAAAWPGKRDRLRLRVRLTAQGADSLYRALPPDTGLLVLPDG